MQAQSLQHIVEDNFTNHLGFFCAGEIAPGTTLMTRGTRLDAAQIGALAVLGYAEVSVYRRPRVAILSTGDELVPIGTAPAPGQVVSSNGVMLAAAVIDAGGIPLPLPDTAVTH